MLSDPTLDSIAETEDTDGIWEDQAMSDGRTLTPSPCRSLPGSVGTWPVATSFQVGTQQSSCVSTEQAVLKCATLA